MMRVMKIRTICALIGSVLAFAAVGRSGVADETGSTERAPNESIEQPGANFTARIAPFLEMHCHSCHGGDEPEGGLALDGYIDSSRIQTDFEVWEKVLRAVRDRQMPPADMPQPSEPALQSVIAGLEAELATFDCRGVRHPGRVTIRRLNRAEYDNTVRDLTGLDLHLAEDFPSDDVGAGFDNIGDVLSIPPILMEKYLTAAETIAEAVFENDAARQRLFVHRPGPDLEPRAAAVRNLRRFASRAFRRPVTDDELQRLLQIVQRARESGSDFRGALEFAMQAILVSPHFLFRIESDPAPDDEDGIRELNDYEIASRLSYFLWSTMPDERLFELAAAGQLRDENVLRSEVERMLGDPKNRALTENFAGQWLQLRSLADIAPDPERFPGFDEPLRQAMRRETELFFETIIQEDRSVLEFLSADFTFVNERLARHYGIDGVMGADFRRVSLSGRRRGVLTQASILSLTSNPTRTSPVKRGKWILENILDEPPPPPPAGVEELDAQAESLGSLRERMEQHRANESCAVCHRKMDALGFGLENFDVTGAWRDRDGRFDIDPSGTLPSGLEFTNAADLMRILAEQKRDEFCRCLTRKLLTYALGRGLDSSDRCAIDIIVEQLEQHDYRFSALVQAIVLSDPFLMREAPREES